MRAKNPSKSVYSRINTSPWTGGLLWNLEGISHLIGLYVGVWAPYLFSGWNFSVKQSLDIKIFLQTVACMIFVLSHLVSTSLAQGHQIQPSPSTGKVLACTWTLSSPPFLVGYGLDLLRQIGQSFSSRPQASYEIVLYFSLLEHMIKQVGAKLCPGGGGWFHFGLPFWAVCSNSVLSKKSCMLGLLGTVTVIIRSVFSSQMSCWFLLSILFLLRILGGEEWEVLFMHEKIYLPP